MDQNSKVKQYAKEILSLKVSEPAEYIPKTEEVKNDENCQRLKSRVNTL